MKCINLENWQNVLYLGQSISSVLGKPSEAWPLEIGEMEMSHDGAKNCTSIT